MRKLITILLILFAAKGFGQIYQQNKIYGWQYMRLKIDSTLHIPTFCGEPTLRSSVVGNQAAIALDSCNKRLYFYDPKDSSWNIVGSGGVVIGGDGVDSVTYSSNELCQWVDGVSTCYRLNKFFDSTSYNEGKIYYYNNGTLRDSVNVSDTGYYKSPIYRDGDTTKLRVDSMPNMIITADTSDMPGNGVPTLDMVNARMGGGSGGVSKYVTQGFGVLVDSTSNTYNVKIDSSKVATISYAVANAGIYKGAGAPFTTYAKGDLIYANNTDSLSRLPVDSDYKVLTLINGLPAWSASGVSWSRSGNAGTTAGTDFIGTTDNTALRFKVNNLDAFNIGTRSTYGLLATLYGSSGSNIIFDTNTGNSTQIRLGKFGSYTDIRADGTIQGGSNVAIKFIGNTTSEDNFIASRSSGSGAGNVFSARFTPTSSDFFRVRMDNTTYGAVIIGVGASALGAILDIESTTQGSLPFPRMTTTQRNAITSPATALQSYDTDLKQPQYYDGSNWQAQVGMTFGTAAPSVTPTAIGNFFLDTTNKKLYIATGTSSSSDWNILN